MSVVLKVSRSGYYVFNRKESKRSQQNRALLVKIRESAQGKQTSLRGR